MTPVLPGSMVRAVSQRVEMKAFGLWHEGDPGAGERGFVAREDFAAAENAGIQHLHLTQSDRRADVGQAVVVAKGGMLIVRCGVARLE